LDIFPHFSAHFYTMTKRRILAIPIDLGRSLLTGLVLMMIIAGITPAKAQDGKALFSANCASCHAVLKDATGPALTGVEGRWPSKDLLRTWIKNWEAAVATGDSYAKNMSLSRTAIMNKFTQFSDKDVDAILAYIESVKPEVAKDPGVDPKEGEKSQDSNLLYGVLTLILGIIALTLLYVNSNLRKISEDKEGIVGAEPVPFYRNKVYLMLTAIVCFIIGGYTIGKAGMGLGRSKDYQPEQPIYYSHKVHAGLNQINCLYCHTGAQEGKQATIPSVNVCMNCHMNIKEYTGKEKLIREDGSEVNGTGEIKKLYEYAGFSGAPGEIWNPAKAKATGIPWIKIHNLPDHVYFNHSQHVKVGQVECQKCHGEIQEMGEVKQHADLSMGWCVNCHRETGVQYTVDTATGKSGGNGFYDQYSKFHEQMKSGNKEKLTVKDIGGTECQKCHY
jgi:mono/diheme cytochrome c family protein